MYSIDPDPAQHLIMTDTGCNVDDLDDLDDLDRGLSEACSGCVHIALGVTHSVGTWLDGFA